MKATVVDLRYRMKDVLKALDRNEEVKILYHGKVKGVISAVCRRKRLKVAEHAFFAMDRTARSVDEKMTELRGGRYRDL